MSNNNNNNKKEDKEDSCFHSFRLFSYLSMTILTIAILVGMYVIFQHIEEEKTTEKTVANQETLMENQRLLFLINQNQTNDINLSSITQQKLLQASDDLLRDINISLANEKNILKLLDLNTGLTNETAENQQLLTTLLNEMRTDNMNLFKKLANMTDTQTGEFLDLMAQGVKLDSATNIKIDLIDKKLNKLLLAHNLPVPQS